MVSENSSGTQKVNVPVDQAQIDTGDKSKSKSKTKQFTDVPDYIRQFSSESLGIEKLKEQDQEQAPGMLFDLDKFESGFPEQCD